MLDIKLIRQNPELVKQAMRNRGTNMDNKIDEILQIDEERRAITSKAESMKAQQNAVSKQIPMLKKEGKDISNIMDSMKLLSKEIGIANDELSKLEEKQRDIILSIPISQ